MGRKPNTEQRRAEIVEALRHEMAEVGYERASTKSIATRAGLAPGLVHYHFASKEAILLALVDRLIESAEQRFAESAGFAARARLAAFVATRVGLGAGSDPIQVRAWVGVIAETLGQAGVRERIGRWLAKDQARLAALFKAAGSRAPKPHAALLLAMILGSFSLHAIDVRGVPRGYALAQILAWLDAALSGSDLAVSRRSGSRRGS